MKAGQSYTVSAGKSNGRVCGNFRWGQQIREILEEHAGGMRDGFKFRGLLPGGASTMRSCRRTFGL